MHRVTAVLAAVLSLASASVAGAAEQEHHLGVDLGVGILTISDQPSPDVGLGAGFHYTYGITDQFNLIAEVQYSRVAFDSIRPTDPPTHPSNVWNADVGVAYVFDVLRWVPYVGALGGGYVLDGGTIPGSLVLPGAEIALGLDYLLTPTWSIGVEGSEHFLFTHMSLYTSFTNVVVRAEFIWGR